MTRGVVIDALHPPNSTIAAATASPQRILLNSGLVIDRTLLQFGPIVAGVGRTGQRFTAPSMLEVNVSWPTSPPTVGVGTVIDSAN